MIFSKRTIRTLSIPKNEGKFITAFGSYEPKNLETVNFDQEMALNGRNLVIPEFSLKIEYDFLKEDHKNNFNTNKTQYEVHTKNYEIHSCVWKL